MCASRRSNTSKLPGRPLSTANMPLSPASPARPVPSRARMAVTTIVGSAILHICLVLFSKNNSSLSYELWCNVSLKLFYIEGVSKLNYFCFI
ncbi:uncharacterized protein DS421_6g192490 [Arachis hypogaea]|nr:uncharacterized protein DS421_6g192490 [Arachis hypogaea]